MSSSILASNLVFVSTLIYLTIIVTRFIADTSSACCEVVD